MLLDALEGAAEQFELALPADERHRRLQHVDAQP